MGNKLDLFGIKEIYQTNPARNIEWFLKNSAAQIMADPLFDLDENVEGGPVNGFTLDDNGQVRLSVFPTTDNIFTDADKDKDMNQAEAKARGYIFKPGDWQSVEMTGRFKMTNVPSGDDGSLTLKAGTGGHSTPEPWCDGSDYVSRLFCSDVSAEKGHCEFAKEQWHSHYKNRDNKAHGFGSTFNRWVGVKFVKFEERSQDGLQTFIVLEHWLNNNNDGITWNLINRTVDTGGWGNAATDCGADRDDEIITWGGPRVIFRWDDRDVTFKDLTVREISPGVLSDGTIGDPVPPPTVGTIARDFTFKYHIIAFADNACGVGTSTPLVEFYNVTDNGSQSNLHRDRYRACTIANGAASDIIGKKPRRVLVRLNRGGTPPAGVITVVLRKGSDDSVAVTYSYTGGTLNATDLTGTKTDYTFENLTANYAMQLGDRICVEYSGNTVDTINEVNVWRNTSNPFDGTNTCAIKFDSGGPPPEQYSSPDTSRDYAWIISE